MTTPSSDGLAVVSAIATAGVCAMIYRRARGTTLAAAVAWAVVAAAVLAATEAGLLWREIPADTLAASFWRYAAAVGTFCPVVAVLGAKRPQDRGWVWVVLTLWLVLLAPAGQALVARSGNQLELFPAWRILLGGLLCLGLLNYLPTARFGSALLLAVGQLGLLSDYLFDAAAPMNGRWRIASFGAILAASLLTRWRSGKRRPDARCENPLGRSQVRWRAFRDGWGAFWGLRILQRINHTAQLRSWPVRLEWWHGFVTIAPGHDGDINALPDLPLLAAEIEQTLDSLLWRFERTARSTEASPGGQ